MIRRWSRINSINLTIDNLNFFKQNLQLVLLKTSIYHRKFFTEYSQFNRRIISQWKRRSNWLPYCNILNHWSADYIFYKKFVKFQFISDSFRNTVLFYNFNFIKKKKTPVFRNLQNFIFVFISKNTFKYFNKTSFFFKNCNPLFNFTSKLDVQNRGDNFVNLLINKENVYFSIKKKKTQPFDLIEISDTLIDRFMVQTVEFYKILNFLFYLKITKR